MKNHPTYNHNLLSLNETISSLYNLRNNIINYVEPIPDNCSNCYNTKSRYIYKSRKLTSVNFSFVSDTNLANPKSQSFDSILSVIKRFSGLMSR